MLCQLSYASIGDFKTARQDGICTVSRKLKKLLPHLEKYNTIHTRIPKNTTRSRNSQWCMVSGPEYA